MQESEIRAPLRILYGLAETPAVVRFTCPLLSTLANTEILKCCPIDEDQWNLPVAEIGRICHLPHQAESCGRSFRRKGLDGILGDHSSPNLDRQSNQTVSGYALAAWFESCVVERTELMCQPIVDRLVSLLAA